MGAFAVLRRDEADEEWVSPRWRVMIIEDEVSVRELIGEYLELEGFQVMPIATGTEALWQAAEQRPDLVILDVNLPGMDGFEVARRLRATSAVAILMLTGRADAADKLTGFDVGVDDYMTKPFHPRELVMRVRALMRRVAAATVPAIVLDDAVRHGDLLIQPRLREVRRDGVPLELTAMEFDLLHFLAAHPKQVFTRAQLLHQVWHYEFGNLTTVTVHMSRLRAKVERDPSHARHLRTVLQIGYKFEP